MIFIPLNQDCSAAWLACCVVQALHDILKRVLRLHHFQRRRIAQPPPYPAPGGRGAHLTDRYDARPVDYDRCGDGDPPIDLGHHGRLTKVSTRLF
jgi:hypothetical protein